MILTVDPGLRACGCAAWDLNGELLRAGLVVGEPDTSAIVPDVVEAMAGAVERWTSTIAGVDLLVIERPQTYRGRAQKGDTNDLLDVSLVVGAVHVHIGSSTRYATPAEWKGNTPKHVTEAQAKEKLSAKERAVIELPGRNKKLASNVWDAIGIGLWRFRR